MLLVTAPPRSAPLPRSRRATPPQQLDNVAVELPPISVLLPALENSGAGRHTLSARSVSPGCCGPVLALPPRFTPSAPPSPRLQRREPRQRLALKSLSPSPLSHRRSHASCRSSHRRSSLLR